MEDKKMFLEKGYSEAEIEALQELLYNQMEQDKDVWGRCCFACPHYGQATKGCGLWCLKNAPRPGFLGERKE